MSGKESIEFDLSIDVDDKTCEMICKSLNPDNDSNITMNCSEGKLKIHVKNLKIASLYNITDDIVRTYEISKKIVDERI